MKNSNILLGYLLIGIGIYFLLDMLNLQILNDFYTWPMLLMIIGIVFFIYSFTSGDYHYLFWATIISGIGIHLYGHAHFLGWIDHWSVYSLIVGIAFLVRSVKKGKGLILGLILIAISIIVLFSIQLPSWLSWIYTGIDYITQFWPIILIALGVFIVWKRK